MSDEMAGLPLPLSGETRVYIIVGDPIAQVGSPLRFNTAFRRRNMIAVLIPAHVLSDGLLPLLSGLRHMRNLDGIVVTVPHKFAVLDLVDEVGVSARRIGAINAIRCQPDGTWLGDNFDGKGCLDALQADGRSVSQRKILLVGAGGAGSAVAHSMADGGACMIHISDLDDCRQRRLAESLIDAHPHLSVEVGSNDPSGFDVVVNCTPLGMRDGDPFPVDPDAIRRDALVVDVILKPHRSPFLKAAEARGCATQPGSRMLEGQIEAMLDFFTAKD